MTVGLDTNVLVRYLLRDDQDQLERALRLIVRESADGAPALITPLVLLETEWVLRSRYEIAKDDIARAFGELLDCGDFSFEHEAAVEQALQVWLDSPADFAECLISACHRRLGCRATATFDRRAARLPGFMTP